MTNQLILDIFQTSLMMSVLILAVFLLSPLLSKRYITKMRYWLWLVIALRLIVPFQLSFTPSSAPVNIPVHDFTVVEVALPQSQPNAEPQAIVDTPATDPATSPTVNGTDNNTATDQITTETIQQAETVASKSAASQSQTSTTYSLSAIEIAAIVWLLGLSAYLIYQLVAMLRFRGLLKKAERLSAGSLVYDRVQNIKSNMGIKRKIDVLVWEQAPSPFLTGLLKRKLVLPAPQYSDGELDLIIRHELTHNKRRDLWYKAFLNIANAIHWFNPIVYYMNKQASKDLELICDETLVAGRDIDLKKLYGELILQNVEQRRSKYPALSTHMSTDKKTITKRIKNIMETSIRKKGITVILCVLLGIVLIGNLVACSLFETEKTLESVWVNEVRKGNYKVLLISDEFFRSFTVTTEEDITEQNIIDLLTGNPANIYFYTLRENSLSLVKTNPDTATSALQDVKYNVTLSGNSLELVSSENDDFWLEGVYTYLTPHAEVSVALEALNKIVDISAGWEYTMAIKADGTLWTWGSSFTQYAGNLVPKKTPMKNNVVEVSAGANHVLAVDDTGGLWAWGENSYGQLGNGMYDTEAFTSPTKIMDDVKTASAGANHSLAIKTDGSLWVWGSYYSIFPHGEYLPDVQSSNVPVKIMDDTIEISAGVGYSLAIKIDGSLWIWGDHFDANWENPPNIDLTPEKIMDNVAAISAGDSHFLAIKSDGSLWAYGNNGEGQIGDNTFESRHAPVKIMDSVAAISAGGYLSMALKTDGSLWTWGCNHLGRLGSGLDENYSLLPVKIMDDVKLISAGTMHSLAMKTDGSLWGWGDSYSGAIGQARSENGCYTPAEITFIF